MVTLARICRAHPPLVCHRLRRSEASLERLEGIVGRLQRPLPHPEEGPPFGGEDIRTVASAIFCNFLRTFLISRHFLLCLILAQLGYVHLGKRRFTTFINYIINHV